MNGDISLVMYHGGRFVRNGRGNREYTGKGRRVWDVDPDLVCIPDLKKMVVECGNYGNVEGVQWMRKEFAEDYDLGLRPLSVDSDIINMVDAAKRNGNCVDVYVTHYVMECVEVEHITEAEGKENEEAIMLAETQISACKVSKEPLKNTDMEFVEGLVREVQTRTQTRVDLEPKDVFGQASQARQEGPEQNQNPDDFPCADELIQQEKTLNEELSKMRKEVKRKGKKKVKKVIRRKRFMLPPSDSDSDSGYEDYHAEFIDAPGHRESYYQDADENGGGSVIVQDRREGESEGDDSYHFEVLKSPISTDSDSGGTKKAIFPQFNEGASFGEVVLEAGMEFATLVIFKEVVRDYTIWKGKDIRWVKDESYRARAKCKSDIKGCQWEIYYARNNLRNSFQIKTYHEHHNCSREPYISAANRKWVVKKLVDKVRVQPTISHKEVLDYFKLAFNVVLEDSKITRSLKEARQIVEGSEKEQYGLVWDYANELGRTNPESTLKIDTIPIPDSPP